VTMIGGSTIYLISFLPLTLQGFSYLNSGPLPSLQLVLLFLASVSLAPIRGVNVTPLLPHRPPLLNSVRESLFFPLRNLFLIPLVVV